MHDGDNLKRGRPWPVNDTVIGIARQCPKKKGTESEIRLGMPAQRGFRKKVASVIDRLFDAVRGIGAVLRYAGPYVENVGFARGVRA